MRPAILLTLVYLLMAFLQPFMPSIFGNQKWLIGMTPILLAYASLRTHGLPLTLFVLIGGCVHDLLLMHYIGFGPLLWGITVFVVASQRPWLEDSGWIVSVAIGFVASFLYYTADRILYLLYHGFWSWDLELSYALLSLSVANAILSPLLFLCFDGIIGKNKRRRGPAPGYVLE